MEDLPLGRIAALVPEFAVKDLPLGRTDEDDDDILFIELGILAFFKIRFIFSSYILSYIELYFFHTLFFYSRKIRVKHDYFFIIIRKLMLL